MSRVLPSTSLSFLVVLAALAAGPQAFCYEAVPDWRKESTPLDALTAESALVVIGTAQEELREVTAHVELKSGTVRAALAAIKRFRIKRVVSSVWTQDELREHLVPAGQAKTVDLLECVPSTAHMEAMLIEGRDYLLWLRACELPAETEKDLALKHGTYYVIACHDKGAICLSDVTDLNKIMAERRERRLAKDPNAFDAKDGPPDLLEFQKAFLKNALGTEDAQAAVDAADAFSEALFEKADTEKRLADLAQKKALAPTASALLKSTKRPVIRYREKPQGREAAPIPTGAQAPKEE